MVPGRRFSTTTSARRIRRRNTSLPSRDLRSSARERLFRFRRTKLDDSPSRNGAVVRTWSPPSGFSIFTTSAPRSASCSVQKGAAMKLPTSMTRMPANADSGMGAPLSEEPRADAGPDEQRLPHGRHAALQPDQVPPVEEVLGGGEQRPTRREHPRELHVEDGEPGQAENVAIVFELVGGPAQREVDLEPAQVGEARRRCDPVAWILRQGAAVQVAGGDARIGEGPGERKSNGFERRPEGLHFDTADARGPEVLTHLEIWDVGHGGVGDGVAQSGQKGGRAQPAGLESRFGA